MNNNVINNQNPDNNKRNKFLLFFKVFKKEFNAEVFANKHRIIKMIGLCFVPFLYIFICIWAFWNPFMELSSIPSAVVDYEKEKCWEVNIDNQNKNAFLVSKDDIKSQKECVVPKQSLNGSLIPDYKKYIWGTIGEIALSPMFQNPENKIIHLEKNPDSLIKANLKYINLPSGANDEINNNYWVQLRVNENYDNLTANIISNALQYNFVLESKDSHLFDVYIKALENNLKAITGKIVNDAPNITDPDYSIYKRYLGADNGDYYNSTLQFWSTYRNNYLSGYFMNIFSGLMDGLAKDLLGSLIGNLGSGIIKLSPSEVNSANNSNSNVNNENVWIDRQKYHQTFSDQNSIFLSVKLFSDLPLVKIMLPELSDFLNAVEYKNDVTNNLVDSWFLDPKYNQKIIYQQDNSSTIVDSDVILRDKFLNLLDKNIINNLGFIDWDGIMEKQIQGEKLNEYGIGLGQFFLCIGAYVGTIVQTIVLDRKKRTKDISDRMHYLTKTLMMLIVGTIQISIALISIYLLGWNQLGESFGLLYIWMLLTVFVFIFIVQGLWFLIRDELLARIAIIIYMIISLTSGWGTFPSFMQNEFFHGLSYITPYTYSIHGQGIIIYGISTLGPSSYYSSDLLNNFGFLLIFAIIFLSLGLFGCWRNNKMRRFGTLSNYKINMAIKSISMEVNWSIKMRSTKFLWFKFHNYNQISDEEANLIKKVIFSLYPNTKKRDFWYRHLEERD